MKFTIFTPTYNRVNLLKNLFTYLFNEKYFDMEWLIVDDGSVDGTRAYIEHIQIESNFPIRYIYQENSGKYIAFNRAIEEAKGKYFICIDSDDRYTEGALFELDNLVNELSESEAGMCYLAADFDGQLIGSMFPDNIQNSNLIDLYYKYGVKGDKGILHKTEVLRQYRFPIIENEKFVTENVLYAQISKDYTYRLINKVYELVEYQKEGLSNSYQKLLVNNPHGALLSYQVIDEFNIKGTALIKNTIRYTSFVYFLDKKWRKYLWNCKHKVSFILLSPIGYLVSKYYKNV